MKKNSILFIFIVLVIGMLIGTIFSMVVSAIIPEGVVKDFFLIKK